MTQDPSPQTEPLPDAVAANWVDRWAPVALRPWLQLGRFDRPAGIWLLLLPGWQAIALAGAMAGKGPDLRLMVLFALGSALMRAAGCAYNDIVDRDFDAKVARTAGRPIPSGRISVKQAWAFTLGCCLFSFLILISLPPVAMALWASSVLLVAAYPFMKRITWWPQAWLGLTFNWGTLLGFAAATGGLQVPALLLYASGIFWTLGYDTIYAVPDLEDDALAGVKSSARRLGEAAPKAVMGFYLIAIGLALASLYTAKLGPLSLPFLALFALHLIRQARSVRIDDPMGALNLFRSNRDAGLLLLAALMAGFWHFGSGG